MAKLSFLLLMLCAILALVQGHGPRDNSQRKLGMSYKTHYMKRKKNCKSNKCNQGYWRKKKVPVTKYQWRKYHQQNHDADGHDNNGKPTPRPPTPPSPTPPSPGPPSPTKMPSVSVVATSPPTLLPTSIPLISVTSTPPTAAPMAAATNSTVPSGPTTSPTQISFANATEGGSAGNETDTEQPTPSPVAAVDLRPPEKVVTERAAPTSSPTSLPTASVLQTLETRSIRSETLHFRASGTSDLGANKVVFFEEVERILAPYATSQIGPELIKFLLSVVFEDDKKDVVSLGLTGQNTLYRSVFQIEAIFDLEGDSDMVNRFGRRDATSIVGTVFQDQLLDRLLLALANRGIRISNIGIYDPKDDANGSEGGGDTTTIPESDDPDLPESKTKDKSRRNAVLVTLFSGALVIFALCVAIFLNNRRRRRYYHYGEKVAQASRISGSQGPLSISETSEGGGSKVQRAAGASKSYDSRDFLRRDATMASGLEPMLDDIENSYTYYTSPSYEEEKLEMEPLDPTNQSLSSAGVVDPNAIAGATLTALDGTGSVSQLNESYPEFEMFAGLKQPGSPGSPQTQYDIPPSSPMNPNKPPSPISPYWSVDGALSGPEDEEYQSDRRRWQDEANDIGLTSAPDHNSRDGESTSDAYNSSSTEESEKGWSDESESEDGRKVQVLPSLD